MMGLLLGMPLACSGHLLIDLPIFMGPVVVLAGWLLMVTRRARRQERAEGGTAQEDTATTVAHDREAAHRLLGVHA
jgi:hypothetical protein